MVKLTIEIPDQQADLIADWASINRTLSQASRTTTDQDCAQEIEDIMPALHSLQMAVRDAVWALQPDRTAARRRNRL